MRKRYLLAVGLTYLLSTPFCWSDVIGLKTATKVGDKISFTLNAGVKATLKWGDGTQQETEFASVPQEFVVKSDTLTIETEDLIGMMYCPENQLVSLNTAGAPALQSLICSDNQLTSLNMDNNTALKELDCQNNLLENLSVSKCKPLTSLNFAFNNLKSVAISGLANLRSLISAGNQLESMYISVMTNLKHLWCQENKMKNLDISPCKNLIDLYAFDNEMEKITVGTKSRLTDIWVDHNNLVNLDLSGVNNLEVVSADHNQLTLVEINKEYESMREYYVHNNALIFNSLPPLTLWDKVVIDDQSPYVLTEKVEVSSVLDLSNILGYTITGSPIIYTLKWFAANGTPLVQNTDFSLISRGKYSFLKRLDGVYAEITTGRFPDVTFQFQPFNVVEPTAISDVQNNSDRLKVVTTKGQIQITCTESVPVRVSSVSQIDVFKGDMSAGTHTFSVVPGVYIVNGIKYVVY